MAIFKRQLEIKGDEIKYSKNYYIRFTDHNGITRIVSGLMNKRATENLEDKINELVELKRAKMSPAIAKWVTDLPNKILKNLVKYGIIDNHIFSNTISANVHLESFNQYLLDKGCSAKYIGTIIPRLRKVVRHCNIVNINDLQIEIVSRFVANMPISDQTRKHYHRSLKGFSRWLFMTGRTPIDYLERLHIPRVKENVRVRRCLTTKETSLLLNMTAKSQLKYKKVGGQERHLIYRVALETGLRANEIRTLRVNDLDFENKTLRIKAKNEKSRRGAILPLQDNLSNLLQIFVHRKSGSSRVFNVPESTSEMLRVDLKSAGIKYKTEDGYADFHALRHTYCTLLSVNGTSPQIAQRLMRHTDPRLTQSYYTHLSTDELRQGCKLPDFSNIEIKNENSKE